MAALLFCMEVTIKNGCVLSTGALPNSSILLFPMCNTFLTNLQFGFLPHGKTYLIDKRFWDMFEKQRSLSRRRQAQRSVFRTRFKRRKHNESEKHAICAADGTVAAI